MKDEGRQEFFQRQKKCLTLMGHSLEHNVKESKWKQIAQFIRTLVVLSAEYPLVNFAIHHINDLELATASLSVFFTNVLTTIKILTFLVNKTMFLEIMNDLTNLRLNSDRFGLEHIKAANLLADRMVNFYFYSVGCTGIYFMTGPIVRIAWMKLTDQPVVLELPVAMKFFFDSDHSPGYECVYLYTGWIIIAVINHAVAIDGLFISFAVHIRSHFSLLQHYIETNSFQKTDNEINYDISSYVKYHATLLSLAKKICQIYKPIIFGQFFVTSLQVCVIVYQLVTHMDNVMILMINSTFLVSIMIQLLIYCYGGEILKIESLMVGTAIQLSKWYRLSPKHRQLLGLMLLRSQKEVIIEAGFYEASLASFMMIIKAALSYITIIQSIE